MRRSQWPRIGNILFAFIFFIRKTRLNFTTNFTMHQGPKPKIIHQVAKLSPPNVFIKTFVAQFRLYINLQVQCFHATHFKAAHIPKCRFKVTTAKIMIFLPEKVVQALLWNAFSNKFILLPAKFPRKGGVWGCEGERHSQVTSRHNTPKASILVPADSGVLG